MLDANYSININQTYLNNPTSIENNDLGDAEGQMDTMGSGLFEGEKGLELLTLLLQLIMQLIQSFADQENNDSSGEDSDDSTNAIEDALRHNLFMSLLTDSSFDVVDTGYDLFSDEDDDIPYYI